MNATTVQIHGRKRPVRLTPQQIYKASIQPAIPQRIAELLNLARGNASVMPYVTVTGEPCNPLLEQYHQYKVACANAINVEAQGVTPLQLEMADASVKLGISETLLEGWIRADMQLRDEEQLSAATAQQEQFRLLDRVDAAIAYGQVAEMVNEQHEAVK